MKAMSFKIAFFFLIPGLIWANLEGPFIGKYKEEKKINKEFNVNKDALLKVDNSYGNLYITSWNQNKIVIDVVITVSGNNEKKVKQKLDDIQIEFNASTGEVLAKTKFGSSGWGWSSGNTSIEVNYTIKLPITNRINLSNDYGSIFLDKLEGKAEINCDYGKIDIGELKAEGNVLRFDYTSGSSFDFINTAEINADYSGFEVRRANTLTINADYTHSELNDIGSLKFSADYGDIKVGKVKNIEGSGDYVGIRVESVTGRTDIQSDYGNVKIDRIESSAGDVVLKGNYVDFKIGYHPDFQFSFEIKLNYAGLDCESDLDFKIKREQSQSKYYEGKRGTNPTGKITINSGYGNVKLFQE